MFSVFPSHKPDSITTIYIFLGIINKLREFKVYLKIIVWYIPIRFHFLKEPKHIQPFLPVHPKASSTQIPWSAIFPTLLVTLRGCLQSLFPGCPLPLLSDWKHS